MTKPQPALALLPRFLPACVFLLLSFCRALVFAATTPENPPPTNVGAQALSPTAARVTYTGNGVATRHIVSRSTAGGPVVFAGYGTGSGFEDNGLLPGIQYTYTVTSAFDQAGGSSYSDPSAPADTTTWALAGADIGNVGAAGTQGREGHVLSVAGAGADIWGTADEFHFAHVAWTGDAVLLVRVHDVQRTDSWAKAGLMIRESLTPGARYAMAYANPNGDGYFQARAAAGGETTLAGANLTYAPSWLKLTRSGATIRAYQSRDGSAWTEIGSTTLALPETVYVGFAVTSHQRGTLATATFDNFSVSPSFNPTGPAVPVGLTATPQTWSRIQLDWTDVAADEAQVAIEKSDDGINFGPVLFAPVDATTVRVDGLAASTTYHFRVRAVSLAGTLNSAGVSNVVTATTLPPPADAPAPPSNLVATAVSAFRIDLAWADNSTTEAKFIVERSTDGVAYSMWNIVDANVTTSTDDELQPSTTYHYRVRAQMADGFTSEPSPSVSATTAPAPGATTPPSALVATALSPTTVRLTWADNSNDETEFRLESSTDGVSFRTYSFPPANATSADATFLEPATTYHFRILALTGDDESAPSNVATAATQPPPAAPTNFAAAPVSPTQVNLSWTDSGTTATHYQIWRGEGAGGTALNLLATVAGSTRAYTDASVVPATVYRYRMRALQDFTPSEYTSTVTISTPPPGDTGWESRDIGAVAAAGGATETGGTLTVRGSGEDIWGNRDEFHYRFRNWTGDGTFVVRVAGMTNTDNWAKAGIMIRENTSDEARHVFVMANPLDYAGLVWRPTASGASEFAGAPFYIAQMWLKLVRTGNSFQGYQSADGTTWYAIGSAVTVEMASTVLAGVAVTSHADGVLCTATFTDIGFTPGGAPPPVDPEPQAGAWAFGDIGAVGVAGANTSSGNTITISASGADIWDRADAFRFVHRTLTGDGMVEAQVTSLGNSHGWAKAGVMIRESLAPGARNAFAFLTPEDHGLGAQARAATGSETAWQSGPPHSTPYWVRLTRAGNAFTASSSPDGVTWTPFATYTLALPATAYFGFAVTSHDNSTLTTATFIDPAVE